MCADARAPSGRKRGLANLSRRPLLRSFGAGGGGQLQHCAALALAQAREQHDLPVRKLQRIVMGHGVVHPGLLSGTSKKQQAAGAKGGLLKEIGKFGIILLKDFGSILSMRPEAKAEVLGALREIFDGRWTRNLGTDGGKTLSWEGKVGVIFGVTGAIDVYHSVDDVLGNRCLLNRLGPDQHQGEFALKHAGASASIMRKELAAAIKTLFEAPRRQPHAIEPDSDEFKELDKLTKLVVRLRAPTARDRFRRELEYVYGAEGTGRLILSLAQLLAGLDSLGLDRTTAFGVVRSVAMDSVPPLRRTVYEHLTKQIDLHGHFLAQETPTIAEELDYPTATIKRALEDLAVYRLIKRAKGGPGKADHWYALPQP